MTQIAIMNNKPSDRFRDIVRVTRICAWICGADIFALDFRINIRTYLVVAVINLSFAFMFYTIYEGFIVAGDWKIILQVMSLGGGTLLQGYCKLVNSIRQKEKFRYLLNEICAIYEEYELKGPDYRHYLTKGSQILSRLMQLCAFIHILLVLGMGAVTLILAVFFNKQELMVRTILPGIDPSTSSGFLWTSLLQISFVTVGGFGLYAGDMGFFTPVSQFTTLKSILKCKFRDMNDTLNSEADNKEKTLEALKDIFKFHQRYLRFLKTTQVTYFWVILVQVSTYATGIVCSLFCILLGAWPAGYVYMFYCFVMMYVYCGVGTMVEVTNDDFITACYNDVRWYELSVPEKKMLRIMLMMTQNTGGLTIGSVLPLSMNTGLQVTKTIYSIAMMLFNFTQ